MIANARMYSVDAAAGALWRHLLQGIIARAGLDIDLIEHAPPAPIDALWARSDLGAVFMCGLPFSLAGQPPHLIAAPVPSPPQFEDKAEYWSEFVVRRDSRHQSIADTFGGRLALTSPTSQSGYAAALEFLMELGSRAPAGIDEPLYRDVVAPCRTPFGAVAAVLEDAADVAPIDAYALVLLRHFQPELCAGLRVVARTRPTAIPALVSSAAPPPALIDAFAGAHQDKALKPLMAQLELSRFETPSPSAYQSLRSNFLAAADYWRRHRLAQRMDPAFA